MSIIDTLITDRTPADVALVRSLNATGWAAMTDEQRALYLSEGLKGAYKASDLNRVNAAMDYLVGRLKSRGINVELKRSEIPHKASGGDSGTGVFLAGPERVELTGGDVRYEYIENTVPITEMNVEQFVDIENGDYYFEPRDDMWVSNNYGEGDTIASTKFTARRDMSVSFEYSYSTEQDYDTFSLYVGGVAIEEEASGEATNTFSGELREGDDIELSYTKDISADEYNDECALFNFVVTYIEEVIIPIEKEPFLWYDSDVPTAALLIEYLANVAVIRGSLRAALPEIPADMNDGLTIEEANNIEVVLVTIEQFITNMLATYRHCGVAVSGMGGLFF
jgi:hypothetical protein